MRIAIGSLALACALGCSSLVNPDVGRLGDGEDAGAPLLADGSTDGPGCTAGPSCRGDVLIACPSGAPIERDCRFERAYCDEASSACAPWRCEPGSARCLETETLLVCDARGIMATQTPCTSRCTEVGGTARCEDAPARCGGFATLVPGRAEVFDSCRDADRAAPIEESDCDSGANGEDRTFTFTLAEEREVNLELRDWDPFSEIDTVLYLRSSCDDPSTQLGCSDDIDCSASDLPDCIFSGTEYRISRLTGRLGPGTYFVVADAYRWSSTSTYGCGTVRLSLSLR